MQKFHLGCSQKLAQEFLYKNPQDIFFRNSSSRDSFGKFCRNSSESFSWNLLQILSEIPTEIPLDYFKLFLDRFQIILKRPSRIHLEKNLIKILNKFLWGFLQQFLKKLREKSCMNCLRNFNIKCFPISSKTFSKDSLHNFSNDKM